MRKASQSRWIEKGAHGKREAVFLRMEVNEFAGDFAVPKQRGPGYIQGNWVQVSWAENDLDPVPSLGFASLSAVTHDATLPIHPVSIPIPAVLCTGTLQGYHSAAMSSQIMGCNKSSVHSLLALSLLPGPYIPSVHFLILEIFQVLTVT